MLGIDGVSGGRDRTRRGGAASEKEEEETKR
jgi:hypothetical protein